MWPFITQPGLATVVIDFTDSFSPLLVGLSAVVWLSASMLVWAALQQYLAQRPKPTSETTLAPAADRAAA